MNVGKTYVAVIEDDMVETLKIQGPVQNIEENGEMQPSDDDSSDDSNEETDSDNEETSDDSSDEN